MHNYKNKTGQFNGHLDIFIKDYCTKHKRTKLDINQDGKTPKFKTSLNVNLKRKCTCPLLSLTGGCNRQTLFFT